MGLVFWATKNTRQTIKKTMISIHQASLSDLAPLSVLFEEYRVFYKKSPDPHAAKAFLQERIEKKESVIFVATSEVGEMTGFVQLFPLFSSTRMKRLWLLNDLYVNELYRGQGISLALLDRAKELCLETGACGLTLETAKTNDVGNRLYPKAGFVLNTECNFYAWDVG